MKRLLIVTLMFFLLSGFAVALSIREGVAGEVMAEVNRFKELVIRGEVREYVEKIHPKAVELMGGKDRVLFVSRQNNYLMKKNRFRVLRYEVSGPENFYKSKEEIFTVLKARIIIDSPKYEISRDTFIIASRNKKEDDWFFIDGTGINSFEKLGKIFPEFPADIELPENRRKVVHK